MKGGSFLLAWMLAGCTEFLELDSGRPIPPDAADADGDGFPDLQDVCPDVADGQADMDRDGVGDACDPCPQYRPSTDEDDDGVDDACDPCPLGPNTDADGDGRIDACDLCPTVDEVAQINTDLDVLSDGCDPSPRYHQRVAFFDLVSVDPSWRGLEQWIHDGEGLRPAGASAKLHLRDTAPTRLIAIRVTLEMDTRASIRVELDAANFCELACDHGTCLLGSTLQEMSNEPPARVEVSRDTVVRLASEPMGAQGAPPLFSCSVRSRAGSLVGDTSFSIAGQSAPDVAVHASNGVELTSVDLVE